MATICLLDDADEAVDVDEPVVLDVQGVAAEPAAVREQHAFGAALRQVDLGADRVRPVADVDRNRLGDLGATGAVDVAIPGRRELRARTSGRSPAPSGRPAGTPG